MDRRWSKHAPAWFGGVLGVLAADAALAQDSVQIYGLISVGEAHVSNEAGASRNTQVTGAQQNSRLGLRVSENLGAGLRAVAVLENGFDINTGTLQQGGRAFGRQSYVGLSSTGAGTLLLGRQYDMFWDHLAQFQAGVVSNTVATHPGDNDNSFGTYRYNNTIKYETAVFGGLRGSAMYAASEGSPSNRAMGAGLGYADGKFRLSAAYMKLDNPGVANPNGAATNDYSGAPFVRFRNSPLPGGVGVLEHRQWGIGASTGIGAWRIAGLFSQVDYRYLDGAALRLRNADLALAYSFATRWTAGAGVVVTQGEYRRGLAAKPRYVTTGLSLAYAFSQRTDVYVYDVYQRANADGGAAVNYLFRPSSTGRQNVILVGMRHRF